MFKVSLLKKISYMAAAAMMVFAVSACSPKATPPGTSEPADSPSTVSSENAAAPTETAPESSTGVEEAAPAGEASGGLTAYENKEYGITIGVPSEWGAPEDTVNENGLTVVCATEDFSSSIFILVRDIPEETPTLQEYKEASTSDIETLYDPADIKINEIIKINGIDFVKMQVYDATPDEELHQILYAAFNGNYAYEIVVTMLPDAYEASVGMLKQMENSIKLG